MSHLADHSSPADDDAPLVISNPAQLLAELPAMFHFVPTAPCMVLCGSSRRLGPAGTPIMRLDVPEAVVFCKTIEEKLDELIDGIANDTSSTPHTVLTRLTADVRRQLLQLDHINCEFDGVVRDMVVSQELERVLVVLLFQQCCDPTDDAMLAVDDFASRLCDIMADLSVECSAVLCAERIGADESWRYADSDTLYTQLDPHTSQLAAQSVMHGQQILRSRDAIAEWYGPDADARINPPPLREKSLLPADRGARYAEELMQACRPHTPTSLDDPASCADTDPYDVQLLTFVAVRIAAPAIFEYLLHAIVDDSTDADFFGADPWDRDVLLHLARLGTGSSRSAALLLLGVMHYLDGQGAHASECFEQGHNPDFLPSFCAYTWAMVQRGELPQHLRRMLQQILSPKHPDCA